MLVKLKEIFLTVLCVVSSGLAGNYTIEMGSGNYSSFTAVLNAPFWDGDPDGSVMFRPTEGKSFFLNSRGNPFRVTTRLGIQIPNPEVFWSGSDSPWPILAGSFLSMGGVGGGIPFINQPLFPLINISKPNSQELIIPAGNAVETWLVDEYNLGYVSTAGSNISILTTFDSEPVVRGFNVISIQHPGIVPVALSRGAFVISEFWIQDFNGNAADYLSVIPEPSSLSLLLAGGLVALARRRRC